MPDNGWGRKETLVFPPNVPIYSYCAIACALLLTVLFGWEHLSFGTTTLEKAYSGAYLRSSAGALFKSHGSYQVIYLGGPKVQPRRALPVDFEDGETVFPDGHRVPVQLSALPLSQGFRGFYTGRPETFTDAAMSRWLRGAIFEGDSFVGSYTSSLWWSALSLLALLALSIPADRRRFREMKYGRLLRGPVLMDPKEFSRKQKGDGIGFNTTEMDEPIRIPLKKEAQHFLMMGDTGVGKTQLISQLLLQVAERGDSAVVYDPATEYIQKFFNAERGDVVLNPLDARCPYWGPAQEMESNAEADAIAASLYQPTGETKDEFFHQTPAQIFAHLLKYGPTPHQLADWLASDKELLARVEGTEMAFYIDQNAGPQRAGVLSSLGIVAKSFRLLPTQDQANGVWNARTWSKTRKGWVFITSRPTERNTLRPLHSLWIDSLVMRLMSEPAPDQKPVWFVIDELASLQRLPQLHTALTEARKSKNPLVLGFQGRAQLQAIYGDKLAEVMVSQPATKLFMKTSEPNAAQWISKAIGYVEIERVKETKHDGAKQGRNYSLDRQIEPLVMESQITGLDDLHAYLKHGNNVARFDFKYLNLRKTNFGFIERGGAEGELSVDPDTLEPVMPKSTATPKQAEAPSEPAPQPAATVVPEPVETEPAEAVAPASGGEVGTEGTEHRKTKKSRKKAQAKAGQSEPETAEETAQEECLLGELNRQKPAPEKQPAQQPDYHQFSRM
jgi:hypothetical protein